MNKIIPTQDPKYGINEQGQLCNVATGVPIPDDEPIFILRAKDMLAEQTLSWYLSTVATGEHRDAVRHRIEDFKQFRLANPEKMKAPDTVYPFPKPVGEVAEDHVYDGDTLLSFQEALSALKEGYKVRRVGWNGKGMFIFLVPGSTFCVNRPPLLGIYPEGKEINYNPHIDMCTADGSIAPWLASQGDLNTDDWCLVD